MSLKKFRTIDDLDGRTIADSKAGLSNSEEYAVWLNEVSSNKDEIHILRLDGKPIPSEDQSQIRSEPSNYRSITIDGRAVLRIRSIGRPDNEPSAGKESRRRLLRKL